MLVFAALFGVTASASLVVRGVVRDQERRQLRNRAVEATSLLSSLMEGFTSSLKILATLPDPDANIANFAAGQGVSVVRSGDSTVVASTGGAPPVGSRLGADRVRLAGRSIGKKAVVSAMIREGEVWRLVFALDAPVSGEVLFAEVPIDPSKPIKSDLFNELNVAVYAAPRVEPGQLVINTASRLPIRGDPIQLQQVMVGADTWLAVVTPKQPLVGSFAAKTPWFLLAGGALAALLVSALVEVLVRRRAYAIGLVDQRTVELNSARQVADAANRAKSEFLSRMSHELRTPLNAVLGFAQLLDVEDLDDAKQEAVDQILRGGRHLLGLINEVLEISAIETGNLSLSPEPVPAIDVIAEVVDLARPLAAKGGVQFVDDAVTVTDVHIQADRQRLKQVLLNLVSNAIKYNRPGGTVSVTARQAGSRHLRIEVTDTGPGIRPEDFDRLFLPFERLGAEQTEVEGTGIGLALSRRLAEAMGGTLGVSSELGQGSTFWIELPETEGPVERFERLQGDAAMAPAPSESTRRHTIVYIEDNLSNLRLVERVVTQGDDVDLIASMQGGLGVELVREHQPDLVLLDLHLPDIPGEEVLRRLQDDLRTAAIPVVVLSADATSGKADLVLAAGARAYLTKPLDLVELKRLVDDLLGARA